MESEVTAYRGIQVAQFSGEAVGPFIKSTKDDGGASLPVETFSPALVEALWQALGEAPTSPVNEASLFKIADADGDGDVDSADAIARDELYDGTMSRGAFLQVVKTMLRNFPTSKDKVEAKIRQRALDWDLDSMVSSLRSRTPHLQGDADPQLTGSEDVELQQALKVLGLDPTGLYEAADIEEILDANGDGELATEADLRQFPGAESRAAYFKLTEAYVLTFPRTGKAIAPRRLSPLRSIDFSVLTQPYQPVAQVPLSPEIKKALVHFAAALQWTVHVDISNAFGDSDRAARTQEAADIKFKLSDIGAGQALGKTPTSLEKKLAAAMGRRDSRTVADLLRHSGWVLDGENHMLLPLAGVGTVPAAMVSDLQRRFDLPEDFDPTFGVYELRGSLGTYKIESGMLLTTDQQRFVWNPRREELDPSPTKRALWQATAADEVIHAALTARFGDLGTEAINFSGWVGPYYTPKTPLHAHHAVEEFMAFQNQLRWQPEVALPYLAVVLLSAKPKETYKYTRNFMAEVVTNNGVLQSDLATLRNAYEHGSSGAAVTILYQRLGPAGIRNLMQEFQNQSNLFDDEFNRARAANPRP